MATPDDTTGRRPVRNRSPQASSRLMLPLKPAIDAERRQLMHAHAVIKCLSAALLHAIDDEATYYVDTADVAADLIDAAVTRLETLGERAYERAEQATPTVKEPRPIYLC
jgi:hypothetical protein